MYKLLRSGRLRLFNRGRPEARREVHEHDAARVEKKYVYRTRHQLRFRKPREKQCPFLLEHSCSLHPAKPTQCRTFPFWPELVENRAEWNRTGEYCPGIGKGPLIQIGTAMEMAEEHRRAYPKDYL